MVCKPTTAENYKEKKYTKNLVELQMVNCKFVVIQLFPICIEKFESNYWLLQPNKVHKVKDSVDQMSIK